MHARDCSSLSATSLASKNVDQLPIWFTAAPEVESRVVRLFPRATPPLDVPEPARVFKIVRAAFGQRRKTLANALGVLGISRPILDQAIASVGIPAQARGETLPLETYVSLAHELKALQQNKP